MFERKKVLLGIVIILAVGYFTVSYLSDTEDDSHPLKGQKAPNLIIRNMDESTVELSSIVKGKKVVIVDFWASWCGPCRNALPALEKLARQYDTNQVVFLGINVWDGNKEEIKKLLREKDIKTVNIFLENDKETSQKYSFNGIPAIFVLDGDMNVRDFYAGYSTYTDTQIKRAIDKLIQ
ncbi:MAG: TlpA family protein disulfide reductase [Candidatus Hydrogenedens sp.]